MRRGLPADGLTPTWVRRCRRLTALEHERQRHLARAALLTERPATDVEVDLLDQRTPCFLVGERHARRIRQEAHVANPATAIDLEREREHARDRQIAEPRAERATEVRNLLRQRANGQGALDERPRLHEPAVNDEPAFARIARACHGANAVRDARIEYDES